MSDMYICGRCGRTFEYDERVVEDGFAYCPYCDDDEIEEAALCVDCDEWFDKKVLYGMDGNCRCRACLEKRATVDQAIELGKLDGCDPIKVSGFFSEFFSAEKIQEILLREARKEFSEEKIKRLANEYCMSDEYFFADELSA